MGKAVLRIGLERFALPLPVIGIEIEPILLSALGRLSLRRGSGGRLVASLAAILPNAILEGARGRFGGLASGVPGLLWAFQQRVPLKLGIDEGRKLDIGELQQLDRLLQLRRHHKAVALAQLEL